MSLCGFSVYIGNDIYTEFKNLFNFTEDQMKNVLRSGFLEDLKQKIIANKS